MNPRKLSAADTSSTTSHGCFNQHEMSENLYLVPNENETLNSTPAAGMISPNQDEDLFNYLLNSYTESDATLINPDIGIADQEEPSRMNSKEAAVEEEYQADHHIPMIDVKLPGKEDQREVAFLVDVDMERNLDDMLRNEQFPGLLSVADVKPFIDIRKGSECETKRVVLDNGDCDFLKMAEVGGGTEAEEVAAATQGHENVEGSYSGFVDESHVNIDPAN